MNPKELREFSLGLEPMESRSECGIYFQIQ